jgi:hypothetical protein
MQYKIKTPLMASDFPGILDAAFGGKIQEMVADAIERFTIDEGGNPVASPASVTTPKQYIDLANQAAKALGFLGDEGNA